MNNPSPKRDPRRQPRVGDILQTTRSTRMVQATALQNITGHAVIRVAEAPYRPMEEWMRVTTWRRWAEHARVLYAAD